MTGESARPGSAANLGERLSDARALEAGLGPSSPRRFGAPPPSVRSCSGRRAGHPELQAEVDRLLAGDARADEDGFLRVPDALSSTQDQVCDRFEATWREGDWPQIAANPPPEIPGYEILSELGRGGMAVVYKAHQLRLNRLCDLKMIPQGEHAGAEHLVRLLAEAQTIARIRHPNVVQIYGLGDHDGRLYFEMEYIEGGDLAHRLNDTPWAPRPAAQMVAVLARAVEHAHHLGIVHRDLKPANVLLMADGTPKIADFGLAKASRPTRT